VPESNGPLVVITELAESWVITVLPDKLAAAVTDTFPENVDVPETSTFEVTFAVVDVTLKLAPDTDVLPVIVTVLDKLAGPVTRTFPENVDTPETVTLEVEVTFPPEKNAFREISIALPLPVCVTTKAVAALLTEIDWLLVNVLVMAVVTAFSAG
jgi:hypothetical protein